MTVSPTLKSEALAGCRSRRNSVLPVSFTVVFFPSSPVTSIESLVIAEIFPNSPRPWRAPGPQRPGPPGGGLPGAWPSEGGTWALRGAAADSAAARKTPSQSEGVRMIHREWAIAAVICMTGGGSRELPRPAPPPLLVHFLPHVRKVPAAATEGAVKYKDRLSYISDLLIGLIDRR